MDVNITVPVAARLCGLSIEVLREAIASGALPASLRRGDGGILPYHIDLSDLAAWCRRCGYTHLWARPREISARPPRC